MALSERARLMVWDRANGICEMPGCSRPGTEIHHIVHKGMGGRHGAMRKAIDHPSNLALICRQCHQEHHG